METSHRVKDLQGVVEGVPGKESASMLASMVSLCPTNNIKRTTSNMSNSWSSEQIESSTESDGSVKSSILSDGDSANVCGSQFLLRSPFGFASEPGSKEKVREENEGENEVEEDASAWNEPDSSAVNDLHSEPPLVASSQGSCWCSWSLPDDDFTVRILLVRLRDKVSGNPRESWPRIHREHESAATTWTDDKHSSFLNSMEATFVRSLFKQGLGCTNTYGKSEPMDDSEQDCAESRPISTCGCRMSNPSEVFESLQGGSYEQNAYFRLHTLEAPPAPAVLINPWVQHFKQKGSSSLKITGFPLPSSQLKSPRMFDDENGGACDVSRVCNGLSLVSHNCQPAVAAGVVLYARSKSTHEELAWKDLEMLEHYNAKHVQEECTIDSLKVELREQREEAPVVQLQKLTTSPTGEPNSLTSLQDKFLCRLVGRSGMNQAVQLPVQTEGLNHEQSIPVSHLNASLRPTVVSARTTIHAGIPDLNCESMPSDQEPPISAWPPTPEAINVLSGVRHNLEGNLYQPFVWTEHHVATGSQYSRPLLGKHSRGIEGENDSFAIEMQRTQGLRGEEAYEFEPQLSPVCSLKARTWKWGPRGLRRRLHQPSGYTLPCRLRRNAKHCGERILELEAVL